MSQIAVLFTARAVGNMSGAIVTGLLMNRFNGHRVLLMMGVLAVAGLTLAPLSPLLVLLTLLDIAGARAFPMLLAALWLLIALGLCMLAFRLHQLTARQGL